MRVITSSNDELEIGFNKNDLLRHTEQPYLCYRISMLMHNYAIPPNGGQYWIDYFKSERETCDFLIELVARGMGKQAEMLYCENPNPVLIRNRGFMGYINNEAAGYIKKERNFWITDDRLRDYHTIITSENFEPDSSNWLTDHGYRSEFINQMINGFMRSEEELISRFVFTNKV